jgi:pimeloyl-ACP methyl ester carboxylesterase
MNKMNDLVVLLPGITGSILKKHGKVVWGYSAKTIAGALFTGGSNLRDTLALPHDDPDVDDLGDGVTADALMPDLHLLPGLWKIDGYGAVSDALLANFELTEGRNFFRFPYDWRRHNKVAARKLARATHDWLRKWREDGHPDAKLLLIAHSMGGIVSRYFLECMEGWKDTRALITFGTPYRGSLNALDTLANGMKKGWVDLSPLAREFTALYQLLPVFECYDAGDGDLVRVGETTGIPNVDPARAAAALAFHHEIQSAVDTNHALPAFESGGYQTHPIVGVTQTTQVSACRTADGVELRDTHTSVQLGGDGTVPRVSAIPIEMSKNPLGAMYAATKHGSLQNADAVLRHVEGVLSGMAIDLGGFLKPKVQVALELADVLEPGQPLQVRVRPVKEAALELVLENSDGVEVARTKPRVATGGWLSAEFAPPAPGAFRVSVTGPEVETAQDACVVLQDNPA